MRIDAIDIARGYTVLLMPMIHTIVVYGNEPVHESLFATVMAFFAEETGAPLFMFLMGFSAGLKTNASFSFFLKRSAVLMVLAFLLNLLKFVPLFLPGQMPQALRLDLGINNEATALVDLLLIGDILHLASFSFLLFALCRLAGRYQWLFEAWLLLMVWMFAWAGYSFENTHRICAWLVGTMPHAFFPVLPWLFYPLAGKLFSIFIKEWNLSFYTCAVIGIVLLLASLELSGFVPHRDLLAFYKPGSAALIYYTACSMIWLFVCATFAKTRSLHAFKQLLCFLSKHITAVYFIQWILVFSCVTVVGYRQQDMFNTLLLSLLISLLTVLLTRFYAGIVKSTRSNL